MRGIYEHRLEFNLTIFLWNILITINNLNSYFNKTTSCVKINIIFDRKSIKTHISQYKK